jgi:hypothetical protein
MNVALPVVAVVVITVVAVLVGRSDWGRRLDDSADRVFGSRAGWFVPGGVFWKFGHSGTSGRPRYWPLVFGPFNWILFVRGRRQAIEERPDDTDQ